MSKYLIIVEGIADLIFLKDYLMFSDNTCSIALNAIKKNKFPNIKLETKTKEIKILIGGGCTVFSTIGQHIQEHIDDGFQLLVIQDADDSTKSYGGLTARVEYLETIKKELGVDFKTFLFPNNSDDGDLETLLLQIANTKKFTASNSCYSQYIQCVSEISEKKFCDELRDKKAHVFNYFRTYYGMKCAKEENREYCETYWDFNHPSLSSFQNFFNQHLE